MADVIALPKLPTSLETAQLSVRYVFCIHCIPLDLVSDRRPQFVSRVWGAFCKALGASLRLARQSKSTRTWRLCYTASTLLQWPLIFPGLSTPTTPSSARPQEADVFVPSIHLRWSHWVWRDTHAALCRTAEGNRLLADRHRIPTLDYRPGRAVWLSSRDLRLDGVSRKLMPRFVGPYKIDSVVNPVVVKLQLPPSLPINPVIHVSSQLSPAV
nr:uncharacterized protein LOC133609211 [Nerophis lumbriciformis]